MSTAAAASKLWVAASVGLVEALKDQGFARWNYPIGCFHQHLEALKDQGFARWNYPIGCFHQHLKSNIPSLSQANFLSSSSVISNGLLRIEDKASQSEDSLRKVMFLSSWAPN